MAQRTIFQSDISGKEMDDRDHETMMISYGGSNYQLDLTDEEASKVFGEYLQDQYRIRNRGKVQPAKRAYSTSSNGASNLSKEELTAAREWLKDNGYEVSDRGRIKGEFLDAWRNRSGS